MLETCALYLWRKWNGCSDWQLLAAVLFIASMAQEASAVGPNQPLDRPFSLRNSEPLLLEKESHRLIRGEGRRSHVYPRPCFSPLDSSNVCPEDARFRWKDATGKHSVSLSALAGYEYRREVENVNAFEAGSLVSGGAGPFSFAVDGRIFTELHEEADHPSYDREPIDRQDETTSGSLAYTSYSRYRSNVNLEWTWGRLTAARDAAHWGPGILHTLMFNREAIPFNHILFSTNLGPFNVYSLYGSLVPEGDRIQNMDRKTRSAYAHRYEWNLGRNLLLGVSEQLIVYEMEEPFAFIPLLPLFMVKSDGWERLNNGSIAVDFNFRLRGRASFYSEFLIDDVQSPTALFNDDWGNKWGWMAGTHWILDLGPWAGGFVAEYARLEPWVYTHYQPSTAQSANSGYPLGDPLGPNSQSLGAMVYLHRGVGITAALKTNWTWKGKDAGSSLQDQAPDTLRTKSFLAGVDGPDFETSLLMAAASGPWGIETEGCLGNNPALRTRISLRY